MLELRNVAVAAGGVPLLAGLNRSFGAGELVALSGPSGSGKTTLLRAVAGLIDPLEGEVLLRGKAGGAYGWPAYRRQVVLVQQRPVLLEASVEQNLRLAFNYRTARFAYPAQRAAEWLERLGVGAQRLDQSALSLSQGQQQRVCLIRALLVEPSVVLLDEPTSALDPDSIALVEEFVREQARRRSMAALIVTHSPEQARNWCDRIWELAPHMVAPPKDKANGAGRDSHQEKPNHA